MKMGGQGHQAERSIWKRRMKSFKKKYITALIMGMVVILGQLPLFPILVSKSHAQENNSQYVQGLNAYKDQKYLQAFKLWRELAQQGHGRAQYGLGLLFEEGLGLKQDYKQSAKWYALAVKQNVVPAFVNLGHLYAQGKSVEKDYAEAARLWLSAAEMGNPHAMYNLGVMYFTGAGGETDKAKAKYYFEKAAFNGVAEAQLQLSEMQRFGVGGEQDMQQALYWLHEAVKQGYPVAQERLTILGEPQPEIMAETAIAANNMTPDPVIQKPIMAETPPAASHSLSSDLPQPMAEPPIMLSLKGSDTSPSPAASQATIKTDLPKAPPLAPPLAPILAPILAKPAPVDVIKPKVAPAPKKSKPAAKTQKPVVAAAPKIRSTLDVAAPVTEPAANPLVRSSSLVAPAKPAPQAAPKPQKKASSAALPDDGRMKYPVLWLASFKKKDNAHRHWRDMKKTYPYILEGLKLYVYEIDIPGRGLWHRVYGIGLASMTDGRERCEDLKFSDPKMHCHVLSPKR